LITIKNGANITIEGVGRTGELQNVGLNILDYSTDSPTASSAKAGMS
jgi:hypothetical protein